MPIRPLILITIAVLFSVSCQTAKLLPVLLVPHDEYGSEQSYWASGTPVLVSIGQRSQVAIVAHLTDRIIEATVYVRNNSETRFDVDEKKINLFVFYGQQLTVQPDTPCGGGNESDWREAVVVDATSDGWKKELYRSYKINSPLIIKSKVYAAREVMKRELQTIILESVLPAVASGLLISGHKSEAAHAIERHSVRQDLKAYEQKIRSLTAELKTGLFQRHTIWPNSSYMGQIKASVTNIKMLWGKYPSPDYYQICADFGGQEHTFVFTEEVAEEE